MRSHQSRINKPLKVFIFSENTELADLIQTKILDCDRQRSSLTTNKISIVVKNNFNELMKEAAAEEVARSFVVVDASRKDQNIEGMGPKLAGLEMTGISVMVLCNAKDTRTFDSCKIIEADNKAPKLAAEQIASELNKRITNSPRGHRPAARQ